MVLTSAFPKHRWQPIFKGEMPTTRFARDTEKGPLFFELGDDNSKKDSLWYDESSDAA